MDGSAYLCKSKEERTWAAWIARIVFQNLDICGREGLLQFVHGDRICFTLVLGMLCQTIASQANRAPKVEEALLCHGIQDPFQISCLAEYSSRTSSIDARGARL